MSPRKKKSNSTTVPLFSPDLLETAGRLKHKESELEAVLDTDKVRDKERPSRKKAPNKSNLRNAPLIRQWHLIRHLSKHPSGCQIQELCKILKAPGRTIYRDLEALNRAGFPIISHRQGKIAVWTIGPWWKKEFRED